MDKEKIKAVAKSLQFELNDDVVQDFGHFFEEHLKDLEKLKAIDTTGVEPMAFIDASPMTFMREDVVGEALPKEKLLSNAKVKILDFVAIPKAVGEVEND